MTAEMAREAIVGILAALPASELPRLKREIDAQGRVTMWCGGVGRVLGSARRGSDLWGWKRNPETYREQAAFEAITLEAVYRADLRHLATESEATS